MIHWRIAYLTSALALAACAYGAVRGEEPPQFPVLPQAPPAPAQEAKVVWYYVVCDCEGGKYYVITAADDYAARFLSRGLAENDAARRNRALVKRAQPICPVLGIPNCTCPCKDGGTCICLPPAAVLPTMPFAAPRSPGLLPRGFGSAPVPSLGRGGSRGC